MQKEPFKLKAVKGTNLIVVLDIHGCFLYVCLLATVSLMLILDALDILRPPCLVTRYACPIVTTTTIVVAVVVVVVVIVVVVMVVVAVQGVAGSNNRSAGVRRQ